MNVLSPFDGMSGGQISLDELGIKVDRYYASEIKEDAIQVTQHNYPSTIQLGDVCNIKGEDLLKIDLLLGGSPCQNLSGAMKEEHRNGLEGEKSKLFYEYVRLLKETNPKYFLLENVGSMRKSDRDVITSILGVEPININSSKLSGQLRNRLYWTNIPNVTQPQDKNINLNDILQDGWSSMKKARCLLESDSRPLTTPIKMFHRYYSTGFTTLIFKSKLHYESCMEHYNTYFKDLSAKEIDIKLKQEEIDLSIYDGVRYLNQTELEKLQTVPEGYTSILNRNQAAGLLGDGWNIATIKHILSFIPNT